jgi:rhodanese-related sulfurtransferase
MANNRPFSLLICVLMILFFLGTHSATPGETPQENDTQKEDSDAPQLRYLSIQQFLDLRLKGVTAVFIDVRPNLEDYLAGHIPGAGHFPFQHLEKIADIVPPDHKIIVTCGCSPFKKCPHAVPGAKRLIAMGFKDVNVLVLPNGISSWKVTPLEKGTPKQRKPIMALSSVGLTIITPDEPWIEVSEEYVLRRLKGKLPNLEIKRISAATEKGKTMIQKHQIAMLPALLLDKRLEKTPFFKDWLSRGFLKPVADEYLVTKGINEPSVFLNRLPEKDVLGVFIMSHCPAGVQAVLDLLAARDTGMLPPWINLSYHYIISRKELPPSVNKAIPMQGLQQMFRSMYGEAELEEDIRQLVILKYFPDKFAAYFRARFKDYNDKSKKDTWEKVAEGVGLDPSNIRQRFNQEGILLAQAEADLVKALGIHVSPTLLWENNQVIPKTDINKIPGLGGLKLTPVGTCRQ